MDNPALLQSHGDDVIRFFSCAYSFQIPIQERLEAWCLPDFTPKLEILDVCAPDASESGRESYGKLECQ